MTQPLWWFYFTLCFMGVVVVLSVLAFIQEWYGDKINGWVILIIASIALLLFALSIHPIRAHDRHNPGLNQWYQSLNSGKGPCCDGPGVDATILAEVDWESKNGKYRVRIEGEWHDVPPDAVLNVPNLDGRTIVWPIRGWGGLQIRCFMPGSMT